MAVAPGTYELNSENATLSVRTGRGGAIAKAGHDLLIEVGAWSATVEIAATPEKTVIEMTAGPDSLRVVEGTGGMKPLDDDDRAGIEQTIREEILKGMPIACRSTSVRTADDGQLHVEGDLELFGGTKPIGFDLSVSDDGHVTGGAVVKQTAWGVKPYTTLFGTLKVADEVEVRVDGRLSAA